MKKRSITLLEIMIVILLIGLIGGVVSYNLKGTLDKGKAFASKEGAQKLEDILNLQIQEGYKTAVDFTQDTTAKREIVKEAVLNSGLISRQQVDKFIKDGWGEFYHIGRRGGQVTVSSDKLREYNKVHQVKEDHDTPEEDQQ